MSLTPNEAADALRDIEQTGRRSGQAVGYRHTAPFLIVWGLFWVVCYGLTDLTPQWSGIVWPAGIVIASVASIVIGSRMRSGRKGDSWRFGLLVLVCALFIVATDLVLGPIGPRQQGAFIPLIIAALYAGVGLWAGMRLLLTGVAVAALTLFGFYYIHDHFFLWMAVVGGGGLIAAGLWLRTA